jgi:hypothetical protein
MTAVRSGIDFFFHVLFLPVTIATMNLNIRGYAVLHLFAAFRPRYGVLPAAARGVLLRYPDKNNANRV